MKYTVDFPDGKKSPSAQHDARVFRTKHNTLCQVFHWHSPTEAIFRRRSWFIPAVAVISLDILPQQSLKIALLITNNNNLNIDRDSPTKT